MENTVGQVQNPLQAFGSGYSGIGSIGLFISNVLRLFFVVAGIYALMNFMLAGYTYMNAAGDAKKLSEAWSKIWLSLLGLAILVGSFALAALFGQILFGRPDFILNPVIYGPGSVQ